MIFRCFVSCCGGKKIPPLKNGINRIMVLNFGLFQFAWHSLGFSVLNSISSSACSRPPNISLPEMTNLSPFVLRLSFPLRFIKSCLLRPSPTRNARRGSYEISFLQLGELRSLNRDKIIFFVPRLFHLGMEGCCRRIVICSPVLLLLMPVV